MKRAHYFYQFFCQKSNTGYDGRWGTLSIPAQSTDILHEPFSILIPGYCSCCASSYPDDPEKPGLSCPDWLRPNDPALAHCACHCSWKPSSDRLPDSTMGRTFLWARYGFCKDPRLGNNSPPLEYFVSYTLGWSLPHPQVKLSIFHLHCLLAYSQLVTAAQVTFPLCFPSCDWLSLYLLQFSVNLRTVLVSFCTASLSFLLTVSFCFPSEMYDTLLFFCRHCDFFLFWLKLEICIY